MAGPHGNAQPVEQGAHVHVVDVAHQEAHYSIVLSGFGSEDAHALYLAELLHAVGGELLFVSLDTVKSDSLHILDGGGQSVGRHIVGGAGLKLERQALEGCLLETHALNHLASTLIRRQPVEPFLLAVEHADACRTVHLMPAEGIEVAVEVLHVDAEVGSSLSTIHKHGNAMLVGCADDLLHGIDGA